MDSDVRWKQRFDSFDRAFVLLREAFEPGVAALSQLEKEGATHRFQVVFELAWRTLRDCLAADGLVVNPVTPRNVIKEAFGAKLLDDGQVWVDMMLHRSLLVRTYDVKVFEAVLQAVAERYLPAIGRLHELLLVRRGTAELGQGS